MTDFFSFGTVASACATRRRRRSQAARTDCRANKCSRRWESFVANQVLFFAAWHSVLQCAMRMTGRERHEQKIKKPTRKKAAHEVKFSIPLAFCTHSMLHNFSFIYFMHGSLLRRKKEKKTLQWKRLEQHKFLFSCCTRIHALASASRWWAFFSMLLLARTTFEFVIIPRPCRTLSTRPSLLFCAASPSPTTCRCKSWILN